MDSPSLTVWDAINILEQASPTDFENLAKSYEIFREALRMGSERIYEKKVRDLEVGVPKPTGMKWEPFYQRVQKFLKIVARETFTEQDIYEAGDLLDITLWISMDHPIELQNISQAVGTDNVEFVNYLFDKGYMVAPNPDIQEENLAVPGNLDIPFLMTVALEGSCYNVIKSFVEHGLIPEYDQILNTIEFTNVTVLKYLLRLYPNWTEAQLSDLREHASHAENWEVVSYLGAYINMNT